MSALTQTVFVIRCDGCGVDMSDGSGDGGRFVYGTEVQARDDMWFNDYVTINGEDFCERCAVNRGVKP